MRSRVSLIALGGLALAALGCAEPEAPAWQARTLRLEEGLSFDLRTLESEIVALGGVVESARADALEVSLPPTLSSLTLPGLCPIVLGAEAIVLVHALVRVEGEPMPFGFDAPYAVEVTPGCREAIAGRLTWTSARGAPLTVDRRGFLVHGHTPALTAPSVAFGIVPISARHTQEDVLTLRYELGEVVLERTVRIRASQRVSGIPSVPTGSTLYLSGGPFTVVEAPVDHPPSFEAAGALTRATFAASGRYVLAAGARTLALRVGEHRETPLDCGRSTCHQRAEEAARTSPMTGALLGHLASEAPLSCAVPCHATSEPGLPDGGFAHAARDHGWHAPSAEPDAPLEAMPRALRRLAGVGCTACHGPGAIPEESARWAILRSDVCAVCHDAPPRYGHVVAWEASAMARSDADPRTGAEDCAGCHTTDGFLSRIGARGPSAVPDEARPLGIACAACHAPHGAHEDALLRTVTLPSPFDVGPQPICVSCHAPLDVVRASQAVFQLGRGAIDPRSGAPLGVDDVHTTLSCTDCHASSPGTEFERGGGHAFAIDEARCARCHAPRAMPASLSTRLHALDLPSHAGPAIHVPQPDASVAERLAYDRALIGADRAAWSHGPRTLEAILTAIERAGP